MLYLHTVELVPFEISKSMKPYPYVLHAYTSKMNANIVYWGPGAGADSDRASVALIAFLVGIVSCLFMC